MRIGAMRSALSLKLRDGQLTVVDAISLDDHKTKNLLGILTTLQVGKSSLVIDAAGNDNLRLGVRNLEAHSYVPPEGLNLYDLLRFEHVVLTRSALDALQTRLATDGAGRKQDAT